MTESESEWERVDIMTNRLKVPGGWIYAIVACEGEYDGGVVFVPSQRSPTIIPGAPRRSRGPVRQ